MPTLWEKTSSEPWDEALDRYPEVIVAQGIDRLPELDAWYRTEMPRTLAGREPAHVTRDELVRVTEWKMTRGVWRARNLGLVRSNPEEVVKATSQRALA